MLKLRLKKRGIPSLLTGFRLLTGNNALIPQGIYVNIAINQVFASISARKWHKMKTKTRFLSGALLFLGILSGPCAQADDQNSLETSLKGCLDQYQMNGYSGDCRLIDSDAGFAILKTRTAGDNHFLLLPLDKLTGVEDPGTLSPAYMRRESSLFFSAWQSRSFVLEYLRQQGKKLSEKNISLAINAEFSRSQNYLHIHISCLAQLTLNSLNDINISNMGWGWGKYDLKNKYDTKINYDVRKISASDFKSENVFDLVHDKYKNNIDTVEITVVPAAEHAFLLLTHQSSVMFPVAAEELQDHHCTSAL